MPAITDQELAEKLKKLRKLNKLPGIKRICADFGVSQVQVRRAFYLLDQESAKTQ